MWTILTCDWGEIDRALGNWDLDPIFYQPEIARTTFLKGQLLEKLGKDKDAAPLIKKATACLSHRGTSGLQTVVQLARKTWTPS